MSIRAINWALAQRTDGPSAQSVLFVIADTANEHGISRHADPDYIAEHTRQSRATVFRRLEELERAGLILRMLRHMEDGRRSYEVRCQLAVMANYRVTKDRTVVSYAYDDVACTIPLKEAGYEGRPHDGEAESQFETHPPESQIETGGVSPVRLSESHSCDSQETLACPTKSPTPPNPPPGGCAEEQSILVEGWPEFQAAFEADKEPIVRVSIARQLFAALTPDERSRATKAAKGLLAWRARQKKLPSKPSAQTFLREIDAWPGWERHAPVPASTDPPVFVAEGSPEFDAMRVLALIRDEPAPVARLVDGRGPGVMRARPLTAAQRALAQFIAVDPATWTIVEEGSQACGAWAAFAHAEPQSIATGATKRMQIGSQVFEHWPIKVRGLRVPWPWPPRKDGTLCEPRAGPDGVAADADVAA